MQPVIVQFHLTLQRYVFQHALSKAGDIDALAKSLGVTGSEITQWLDGTATAPASVFNKAVELSQPDVHGEREL